MNRITFLSSAFCLIDDWFNGWRVRQRGLTPLLHDSETLSIEVAGAFFGIDTDEGINGYFRRYYPDLFPRLVGVDRTMFARQAANLWNVNNSRSTCSARSPRCQPLRKYDTYSYDDVSQQIYYGLRLHLRLCWPGVIVAFALPRQ
jgi:hypothetical protein